MSRFMLRLILTSFHVRFTVASNRIINFLRSIPGVKKLFGQNAYGEYGLKLVFTILGVLYVVNKKILMHLLYMAFLVFAGAVINQAVMLGGITALFTADNVFYSMTAHGVITRAVLIWLIVSVAGGFTASISASPLNYRNDKLMLYYLRANPAAYAKSRIIVDRVSEFFLYIPFFLVAFALAGITLWGVLTVVVVLTGCRLAGEAVNLWMFRRFGKHFGDTLFSIVGTIVIYAPAFVIPYFVRYPNLEAVITNPLTIALSILLGVAALFYIRNYPLFGELLRAKISHYDVYYAKMETMSASERLGVKKWDKYIQKDNLQDDKHKGKMGFAYLNAIFFDRHRVFFLKKIVRRVVIALAPFAAAALFAAYVRVVEGTLPVSFLIANGHFEGFDSAGDILTSLFYLAPVLLFVVSMASMSRVVTASIFSNCDVQMLHYPYYRMRQTILASFKSRLSVVVKYNLVVTTAFSLSIIAALLILFGEMNLAYAGVFFVLMTSIGVFFAFNDLFLYYVIQPYDSAGNAKSIVFSVVNGAIGMATWMQMQRQFAFFTYSISIVAITLVYLGAGTVLLLIFAPKNFKLR
ncbi:MAG: hypothetical protein FWB97_02915 [Oscillospiraceae bacterium]|nr:hypothetical protein [Oscillospiraceae bacterium]